MKSCGQKQEAEASNSFLVFLALPFFFWYWGPVPGCFFFGTEVWFLLIFYLVFFFSREQGTNGPQLDEERCTMRLCRKYNLQLFQTEGRVSLHYIGQAGKHRCTAVHAEHRQSMSLVQVEPLVRMLVNKNYKGFQSLALKIEKVKGICGQSKKHNFKTKMFSTPEKKASVFNSCFHGTRFYR